MPANHELQLLHIYYRYFEISFKYIYVDCWPTQTVWSRQERRYGLDKKGGMVQTRKTVWSRQERRSATAPRIPRSWIHWWIWITHLQFRRSYHRLLSRTHFRGRSRRRTAWARWKPLQASILGPTSAASVWFLSRREANNPDRHSKST